MKNVTIVVLPHGWVLIGEYEAHEGVAHGALKNGYVLRRWGTTKGLGELRAGPLRDTKLDKLGDVFLSAPLFILPCEMEGWMKALI